jgi:outer membrane protein OmpA-like peptidoglycan-associated protein/Tfp pilus assembly protein PilF
MNLKKNRIMVRVLFLLTGLFICTNIAQAQKDDEMCSLKPENKKVAKSYPQILNPDTPDKTRIDLLKKAIETDPNCTVCYFDLGSVAYAYAYNSGGSYNRAKEYFSKVLELCPGFHSEVYYALALIATDEGDDASAIEYFEKYISFKSDEAERYGNSYDEKRKLAKGALEELKFFVNYFENKVPFDPKPVKNVASSFDEYLPMISPDNELMFFTRRVEGNKKATITSDEVWIEQFMMASRTGTADFQGGKPMGDPFDDPKFTNLGGVTISVDNHEMIICGCKKEMVQDMPYNNCDLYISKYTQVENPVTKQMEYKWSPFKNMGPMINTPDGWEATPTLSGDGKTLYFASRRIGTKDIDIYASKKNSKGKWGLAVPVADLNSNGDDKVPFMHADSKTMYFVSGPNPDQELNNPNYNFNRKGVGGFDLYYARQQDDGKWSKPKLMAYPINTESDEVGIIVSTDGKTAYFASNRNNSVGGQDIFSFPLYEEARPETVVLVKGEVKNEAGKGDTTAIVEITKTGEPESQQIKINEDGSYAAVVTVKKDDEVLVKAKKQGAFLQTKVIKPVEISQTYVKGSDFVVEPVKVGKAYTVDDILFNTASYDLLPQSFMVLDQFVAFLKDNPGIRIEIQGHTDNEGVASKNQILSENRARVVKEYLEGKGIEAGRLTSQGYGQNQPKVPNTSAENKAKNRRTDFKILSL